MTFKPSEISVLNLNSIEVKNGETFFDVLLKNGENVSKLSVDWMSFLIIKPRDDELTNHLNLTHLSLHQLHDGEFAMKPPLGLNIIPKYFGSSLTALDLNGFQMSLEDFEDISSFQTHETVSDKC